jgi:4-diphosphocytidyl-2-C-methyl-D-erythritol kinase
MSSETLLRAPAKLNLCLFVGPARDDGLHEIASIFEPLALADELRVSEAAADEVVCPEVGGPNLVEKALAAMREAGWQSPPLRIEVEKRVPVAAGLGGGSADAAAVLRLARGELEGIRAVAASVGADVPSQIQPRPCLVTGAGEVVEPIHSPGGHAVVLVPQTMGLTTADVYAEADRLGLVRGEAELEGIRRKLRDAVAGGDSPLDYPENLLNDLQPAALSLRPEIAEAIEALSDAGAAHAMVTGSGPTAFGLFTEPAQAAEAASKLTERFPGALATGPLSPGAELGPADGGADQ